MDCQIELFLEFLRDRIRERRSGRNAEPKLRQGGNMFHFTKCLIENRHSWENCCLAADKIGENGAWCSITTDDHRHTARDHWREEITETVRVRDRDNAEIQIVVHDSHGRANLIAIGQKLLAAKANSAWRGCGAGG